MTGDAGLPLRVAVHMSGWNASSWNNFTIARWIIGLR
jgi:hypothetical protein